MIISIYIHIPFCTAKCDYCDFFSIPADYISSSELQADVLDTMLKELEARLGQISAPVIDTIFIGGGTPSSVKPSLLSGFLNRLNDTVAPFLTMNAEFSIEANPETCSSDFIKIINNNKINRLSLGVQSFNPDILKQIGRASYPDDIYRKVTDIRNKWDKNLSLDLITGINADYQADINKVVSISPHHISIYALSLENSTPLFSRVQSGDYVFPSDSLQADAISAAADILNSRGYLRYEVSNYARQEVGSGGGFECRHNLRYWNMETYIGIGPGAVSSIYDLEQKKRITNTMNIDGYLKFLNPKQSTTEIFQEIEILSDFDYLFEHYMMGYRLSRGINRSAFLKRFSKYPEELIPETIAHWSLTGFIDEATCSLNDAGLLFLNKFLADVYDELKINTFNRNLG